MAKEPTKKQTAEVVTDPKLEQEIRRRAYELYEGRGCEHGHDVEDWLRAEAELTSKAMSTAA
jgi:Protein of unknown function (DUF2934)